MNGAFYIGATGLRSQERALDVIANNIANINTPGYKRSEVRFSELMAAGGAGSPDASRVNLDLSGSLNGVSVDASPRVFAQGDLKPTGKPMDIAVSGDGLIELMGPGGQTMLWRGGEMKVNEDGYLAATNGMVLKAMISVPANATGITIGADGKVSASVDGETRAAALGQIDLVRAKDMTRLATQGDGLYTAPSSADLVSGAPGEDGAGSIVQGSIESSNVQLSDEMVLLMLLQRAYAANAQVVQAGDQLMSIANGLKR